MVATDTAYGSPSDLEKYGNGDRHLGSQDLAAERIGYVGAVICEEAQPAGTHVGHFAVELLISPGRRYLAAVEGIQRSP